MRYIMRNKEFGLKVVAPSEKCRDKIIASAKRINGDPVWEQFSVLPDEVVPKHNEMSREELLALLDAKDEQISRMNKSQPQETRRGRPKKQKVEKSEGTEGSHRKSEEADQDKTEATG